MRIADTFQFSRRALTAYPGRTALILLAMSIGVASVIILTSLGEGARLYVKGQFQMLGSNLLIVLPGRSETTGGLPPLLGTSPRDLTIDDALALKRSRNIDTVSPVVVGSAPVSHDSRVREVTIYGSSHSFQHTLDMKLLTGHFFPADDPRNGFLFQFCGNGVKYKNMRII